MPVYVGGEGFLRKVFYLALILQNSVNDFMRYILKRVHFTGTNSNRVIGWSNEGVLFDDEHSNVNGQQNGECAKKHNIIDVFQVIVSKCGCGSTIV